MQPRRRPPYRTAGLVLLLLCAAVLALVSGQFRGAFTAKTRLTLVADRAGLVMDPGAKVTFNGVVIGRVAAVSPVREGAELSLDIEPRQAGRLPANVVANVTASTVFGNKYVAFSSPQHPVAQRVSSSGAITVTSVSTEFNTLFETIMAITEKVDPVRLNATLSATAEALTGLGDKLGRSLGDGNQILDALNPRLPQLRRDTRALADLADAYTHASPDLWAALDSAVMTAGSLHRQQRDLGAALLAAAGFGATASDVSARGGPYFVRAAADLLPTTALLDEYSPEFHCTLRNYAKAGPLIADSLGGNGYSLSSVGGGGVVGAEPPYIYPDNLPRVNARGGPGGRPGCWQSITKQLWPAPFLVMDSGASIAPYNHLEIGRPVLTEFVWGRQIGEYTINP